MYYWLYSPSMSRVNNGTSTSASGSSPFVRSPETDRAQAEDYGELHGKLYYNDSYKTSFDSVVAEVEVKPHPHQDKTHSMGWVRLEGSYFYPSSGGQPNDTGVLAGFRVVDVIEHNHWAWHLIELPKEGREASEAEFRKAFEVGTVVHGEVDWDRRFDMMQQHSGQHLLSGIMAAEGIDTTSVHIGESCTLDCTSKNKDMEFWRQFEDRFHQIVYENRPVTVSYKRAEDCTDEERKKVADAGGEPVRIITIEGIDVNGCCGSHVRQTGDIGPLVIHSAVANRGGIRLSYSLGGRATKCLQQYQQLLLESCAVVRCSPPELSARINQLVDSNKAAEKQIKALSEQVAQLKAAELLKVEVTPTLKNKDGEEVKKILREVPDVTQVEQSMGAIFAANDSEAVVFICTQSTEPYRLIVACSPKSKFNAYATLKKSIEGGKGGGRPVYAMGAPAKPVTLSDVEANLTPM